MTKKERYDLIRKQYPVLYHGTDARILALSTEQRTAFKDSCIEVANYLWPLLKPDVMGMIDEQTSRISKYRPLFDDVSGYRRFTLAASICYHSIALGSPLFKYDGIYLSSDVESARKYSERAGYFGEIGFVAYGLIDGADRMGVLDKICNNSFSGRVKAIRAFAEGEHRGVVVAVDDYDPALLLTELGEKLRIRKGLVQGGHYKYMGQLDLTRFKMV